MNNFVHEERSSIQIQSNLNSSNNLSESNCTNFSISPRANINYLNIEENNLILKENEKGTFEAWRNTTYYCEMDETGTNYELWLAIPLVFPIATLHTITSKQESYFGESKGGCLCFSPTEVNISRLFSAIQGLSDIGAGFFQIVIAKIDKVNDKEIGIIQNEFIRFSRGKYCPINTLIPLKPIGWRKRNHSQKNATVPINSKDEYFIDQRFNNNNSYYNAILTLDECSEECKENVLKLGRMVNKFLEKIKLAIPTIEVSKITDLERDISFEVTIRLQPMPSYVSSEGEDFSLKEKYSTFQNSMDDENIPSIYFGDIRLINPYGIEVDYRIPCGLFKTFSLISINSVIELPGTYMASYVPPLCNNKKKHNQTNCRESIIDLTIKKIENSTLSGLFDKGQCNYSTPKTLPIIYKNKDINIKTPPPNNTSTNNSNCFSNTSTCDMGYNTITNNNWSRGSFTHTPTTKASINKISFTPFSSIEIDSSPWIATEKNTETTSIFSYEQERQQVIPPRISSTNCTNSIYNLEPNIQIPNSQWDSNIPNDNSSYYSAIKQFESDYIADLESKSLNHNLFSFKYNNFQEDNIEIQYSQSKINYLEIFDGINFDRENYLFESECSQYSDKDFDIFNMLENIISDFGNVLIEDESINNSYDYSLEKNENTNNSNVAQFPEKYFASSTKGENELHLWNI
ncbi:hypothetical protein HWI79_2262 [Cryptosporidium felis]|nr:hypothetical protein HWI79_2262 [Cryptosporidium felis]